MAGRTTGAIIKMTNLGWSLADFAMPPWLVEPAVRSCRLVNTALDYVFYDVPTLRAALVEKDAPMLAAGEKPPSRIIDFDAVSSPEGSLLLIDANKPPYVHRYVSVAAFLASPYDETREVDVATTQAWAVPWWEAQRSRGTSR